MSELRQPAEATPASQPAPAVAHAVPPSRPKRARWLVGLAGVLVLLLAVASLALAWRTQQRMREIEQELVRRQAGSAEQANEAHLIAKQAREWAQDATAKVALLEARIAEVALQRSQLEELIQSLARSRDENLLADVDAGLRVALQQTAITGSAQPLVAALQSADERLARAEQPRFEPVRRAIARDLDHVKSVGVADIASLAIKLDEAVRLVDEAPLMVVDAPRTSAAAASHAVASRAAPVHAPSAPAAASEAAPSRLPATAAGWWQQVVDETRALVRVTRIDRPEAMLLAPEQGFFLRENLKLKLLNARLGLLSRQFDTAQLDLQAAASAAERYFDRGARKTMLLVELLHGVAQQARSAGVPRPDETLAALATAAAGR